MLVLQSEYAVDYPIAGGSFTFMLQTFGEFPGWCASGLPTYLRLLVVLTVSRVL